MEFAIAIRDLMVLIVQRWKYAQIIARNKEFVLTENVIVNKDSVETIALGKYMIFQSVNPIAMGMDFAIQENVFVVLDSLDFHVRMKIRNTQHIANMNLELPFVKDLACA